MLPRRKDADGTPPVWIRSPAQIVGPSAEECIPQVPGCIAVCRYCRGRPRATSSAAAGALSAIALVLSGLDVRHTSAEKSKAVRTPPRSERDDTRIDLAGGSSAGQARTRSSTCAFRPPKIYCSRMVRFAARNMACSPERRQQNERTVRTANPAWIPASGSAVCRIGYRRAALTKGCQTLVFAGM